MKTGKVAQIFKVDQKTVMSWVDLFPDFFTDSAKGEHGRSQRDFTDSDVYVLNTIYKLRGEGIRDWEKIRERLKEGPLDMQLPLVTAAVDNETSLVVQIAEIASLRARIAEYEKDLQSLQKERSDFLTTIQTQQTTIQAQQAEISRLQQELSGIELRLSKEAYEKQFELFQEYSDKLAELRQKLGRLEGKLGRGAEDAND